MHAELCLKLNLTRRVIRHDATSYRICAGTGRFIVLGMSILATGQTWAGPDRPMNGTDLALEQVATVIVSGRANQDDHAVSLATGESGTSLDTPFSISSISSQLVHDQAGTTLQDALRNVPGAQADSGFNGSHTQFFSLRGAVPDSGTGSNRVLRDGVRLSNYPYVPGFVESVDVLRGPGAAVGVRSEPGGTVDIVTRQPVMTDKGSIVVSVGDHSEQELTFDLNRTLSFEHGVAARLIATRSRASEWRHVKDQLDGVKLGLAKNGGDLYHLSAGFEATNQVYQPDYGIPAIGNRPASIQLDRQFGEPFGNSTTNNRIVDLHGDISLATDTRIKADLTQLEAHSTSIKNLLNGAPLAGQPLGTYARVSSWEPDTARRITSGALSLSSVREIGGLAHQIFVGFDYYSETLDQPTLSVSAETSPPINIFVPIYGRVIAPSANAILGRSLTVEELTTRSASLQDQVDLGTWSLVGGLRYANQQFLYGLRSSQPVYEDNWSPKLGLLYRLHSDSTIYGNVATGVSPNQVASSSNQSLPSRQAVQAEVGWKSSWLNSALSSDVSVYQLRQTNMISSDQSTPGNIFDFTVDGSARSNGVEAAVYGKLKNDIEISLAYAYVNARYLSNATYGGNRVPNVAHQTLTLWGQYHWSEHWKTSVGLYAQGARYADQANTSVLPGYARFDLTQTWTQRIPGLGAVEVQLALRNALDQRYFVSSHLHVTQWIMPAQERNASLTLSYRF
ncbi:TonB-dependent receptor [Massilia phyllosphaerae]|uniref:TonB-dependent receptor n=1 Tax=Massilia phyllosphaerae TaxID=3106034 RepID=UPI002B1CC722|nr:TonB-dependent receptor [Massilia sp. SGZ-792]